MVINPGEGTDSAGRETLDHFNEAPAFNNWLFDQILPYCKGDVLEAGSGIGNISGLMLDKHLKVVLSDLRSEYCELLKRKFAGNPYLQGVYQLDLSLADFENRYPELLHRFDSVIVLNVIEHIREDALAVRNAMKLLRVGGNLIVLVPAGQCLYNHFDRELGHFKRYTRSGLAGLLTEAGLKVLHTNYFNFGGIFGWWFSGSLMKNKIIPRSQLKLFNRLVPVFRIVDRLVAHTAGVSVIAVAANQSN